MNIAFAAERIRRMARKAHDTATAKARSEIDDANEWLDKQGAPKVGGNAPYNLRARIMVFAAKLREELEVSHRLEQAAWKVAELAREELAELRANARVNYESEQLAHQQPKRFVCCYCGKNARELSSPHYLERVNRTGDTPAIWICTEHAVHQQPIAPTVERDLLYRIGKTLMESQATGEPINLDLIRKEIDELLYPVKQPERLA